MNTPSAKQLRELREKLSCSTCGTFSWAVEHDYIEHDIEGLGLDNVFCLECFYGNDYDDNDNIEQNDEGTKRRIELNKERSSELFGWCNHDRIESTDDGSAKCQDCLINVVWEKNDLCNWCQQSSSICICKSDFPMYTSPIQYITDLADRLNADQLKHLVRKLQTLYDIRVKRMSRTKETKEKKRKLDKENNDRM